MALLTEKIEEKWRPDIVLNNMSCYSAWDYFFRYFRREGDRFRQISLSQFNWGSITLNQFELFGDGHRFLKYKKDRIKSNLTEGEKLILKDFMHERHSGLAPIFKSLDFFENKDQIEILNKISLNKDKRNIFLFSNIYWDVGLSEVASIYPDVITWVMKTIQLLKDKGNIHVYIKPHPGEVYDSLSSLKGIREIIYEKYPVLPSNITIIEPEWKVKTYDLFPYIDLGVIFTGTLGLEMMLSGIPVVSTGKTTHFGLGFASEPNSESEYLELLIGDKETPKYNKYDLELFAYFYFIRSKIPWPFTQFAFNNEFNGFNFKSLDEILPSENMHIDHLCDCIMDLDSTIIESWPNLS
jgi:hypothetical protein